LRSLIKIDYKRDELISASFSAQKNVKVDFVLSGARQFSFVFSELNFNDDNAVLGMFRAGSE